MKPFLIFLLLPLLACEVADDDDHPLHTEPVVILKVDPPADTWIYGDDDRHIGYQLHEAFLGIPPRAIHLENGDWRTVTVTFSAPPQDLSVHFTTGTGGASNLLRGHRLDGDKLYLDTYCPFELSPYDITPYSKIHLQWRTGSRILRTWCQSIRR